MDNSESDSILQKLENLRMWQRENQLRLENQEKQKNALLNIQQEEIYMLSLTNNSQIVPNQNIHEDQKVIKRSFLRRNQGLKARFKFDPDSFRLDNLPKYKFSTKHRLQPTNKKEKNISKVESKLQSSESQSNVMSWSKVLDSSKVEAVHLDRLDESSFQSCEKSDNLSIFELLENRSKENSCHISESFVRKWIESKTNKLDNSDSENLLISKDLGSLNYNHTKFSSNEYSSSSEGLLPLKAVHFSSEIIVNNSKSESQCSEHSNEFTVTSTPNCQRIIKEIRNDDTLLPSNENERIDSREEHLLTRLQILEEQIEIFKRNNSDLIREKQEHDLEKIYFEEQKQVFLDNLDSDRKKMENYYDQQKNKFEHERRRLEAIITKLKSEKNHESKTAKVRK